MTPAENLRRLAKDPFRFATISELKIAADELDRLTAENERLREALEWVVQPDHPIGSNAEFQSKAQAKCRAALRGSEA